MTKNSAQGRNKVGSNPTPRIQRSTLCISPLRKGSNEHHGRILRVLLHLKKQGYRDSTLEGMGRKLRSLTVPLADPERVKGYIANLDASEGHKGNLVNAYDHYCKFHGLAWEKPRYNRVDKIQRIPTESQINKVISHARPRYALAYSILRDTGMRPVELTWLRLKQIDVESGKVYPGTAKSGSARVLQLRPSTLAMLKRYIQHKSLLPDARIWPSRKRLTENWCRLSNSVAEKLGEPSIANIRLYDLRHHYATTLYCKTKDILHVQRQLGHRNITNTLRYIGLVDLDAQEYIVKVAVDVNESTQLLERAFQFVAVIENKYVFRKPKLPSFLCQLAH